MKKRMMCLCLCLCAMMHALPALAEDDALHVLNNSWFAVEAYQAQYPDRPVEVTNPEYDDNGIDTNLETLLRTTSACSSWTRPACWRTLRAISARKRFTPPSAMP